MALNQDLIKGICQTHIQDMSLIKGWGLLSPLQPAWSRVRLTDVEDCTLTPLTS
jgi:hypothetical protein